jgi:hypothetical protein
MNELNNSQSEIASQSNIVFLKSTAEMFYGKVVPVKHHPIKTLPSPKMTFARRQIAYSIDSFPPRNHSGELRQGTIPLHLVHQNEIEKVLNRNKVLLRLSKTDYGIIKTNIGQMMGVYNLEPLLRKYIQQMMDDNFAYELSSLSSVERSMQKIALKLRPQITAFPERFLLIPSELIDGSVEFMDTTYSDKSKNKAHIFLSAATALKNSAKSIASWLNEKLNRDARELLKTELVVEVGHNSSPKEYEAELRANKWVCLNVEKKQFSLEDAIKWTKEARIFGRSINATPIKQIVIANARELSRKELAKARIEFPKSSALFIKYSEDEEFKTAFEKFAAEIRDAHESALQLR